MRLGEVRGFKMKKVEARGGRQSKGRQEVAGEGGTRVSKGRHGETRGGKGKQVEARWRQGDVRGVHMKEHSATQ